MITIAQESWTGSDGSPWPAQWQVASGTGTIQSGQGVLTAPAGYNVVNAMLAVPSVRACEVSLEVTLPVQVDENAPEWYSMININSDNVSGSTYPTNGYTFEFGISVSTPGFANYIWIQKFTAGVSSDIVAPQDNFGWVAGETFSIRFQRIDQYIRVKIWLKSDNEPSGWTLEGNDTGNQPDGRAWLSGASGGVFQPFMSYDNMTVRGDIYEQWNGADGSAWPPEWSLGALTSESVAGTSTIVNNKGQQDTGHGTGFGYSSARADCLVPGLGNYWDISVDFTASAPDTHTATDDWFVSLFLNGDGANLNVPDNGQPNNGIWVFYGIDTSVNLPYVQIGCIRNNSVVDYNTYAYFASDAYSIGTTYTIRARRTNSRIDAWAWQKGQPAPSDPLVTRNDAGGFTGRYISLASSAGTNDIEYTADWENLTVRQAPIGYYDGNAFIEAYIGGTQASPLLGS